jgi:rRNA processing protein Gar1
MQKLLGKIKHISQSGNIIAILNYSYVSKTAEGLPIRLGTKVSISNMGQLGKITGMIGPVKSPYIIIKPFKKITEKIDGKDIYEYEERKREYGTHKMIREKKEEGKKHKWYPSKSFPTKKEVGRRDRL